MRRAKSLVQLHERHNRTTQGASRFYASHRARVMALLADAPAGRLALLGAGNCNDVELTSLAERHDEVHLVDLDRTAIDRARARVPERLRRKAQTHAVDLAGLDRVQRWKRARPDTAELVSALRDLPVLDTLGDFDTVASPCVLSQVVWTCQQLFTEKDALLPAVAHTAALTHLQICVRLLRPRGRLVLVTDTLVGTPKRFADVDPSRLDQFLVETEAQGKCYPFTGPGFVADALHRAIAPGAVTVSSPWIWQISPTRAHLTYAVTAERR